MATPARSNTRKPDKSRAFMEILKDQKWLTLIALPVLLSTTFLGIYSPWGLLFVYWGVTSMRTGEVFLVELINSEDDPALFWIISIMWVGFGTFYVLADFYPELLL